MVCSLPEEVYVALQCWGGSECGSRSYAGNVSLCSARARPQKPTALFKEMAVRGLSAISLTLYFSISLSLCSKRLFLPPTGMIIIFLCGRKFISVPAGKKGKTQRERGKLAHTHTVVWFVWSFPARLKAWPGYVFMNSLRAAVCQTTKNNNKPGKESLKERFSLLEGTQQLYKSILLLTALSLLSEEIIRKINWIRF